MPLTLTATPLTSGGPSRPLLILGPSLGTGGARLWAPVVPLLEDIAHLVVWDLPGHGASAPAQQEFTVADLADAVVALTDEVVTELGEPTRRLHAGVSLGGATTLEIGVHHPGAFSGLALLCSGARIGTTESWTERAALIRERGMGAVVDGSRQRWFAPGFVDRHPELAEPLLADLTDVDAESYARCCEALARFDVRDRLAQITDPVVAVAGVEDQVAPPAMAQAVESGVAHGRAIALPGVAHLAPTEDATATAQILRDLLTTTS